MSAMPPKVRKAWYARIGAESLGHGPHGLGAVPAVVPQTGGKFVHARADVLELALAVVAAAVAVVGSADRTRVSR